MKAAFLYGAEDIRIENLDIPAMEPDGMLIRVACCGICGSDIRMFFKGPSPRYINPVVLGHEYSGEVVQAGPAVMDYHVGDRVTVAPIIPCMRCDACADGFDHLCASGKVIGSTMHGGMAEYFYIPAQMVQVGGVVKVPDGVSLHSAALAELVGCCLHGIRQMGIEVGDRVAVFGDGPIGMIFVQLLRLMGATWVALVGHREQRLKFAEQLSPDQLVNVSVEDAAQALASKFDRAVVATSSLDALNDSLKVLKPGGSLLVFSGYVYGTTFPFQLNEIHYRELHIHGAIDCTIKDFQNAVSLLPHLKLDSMINRSYPLEQIKEAFYATKDRSTIKVMIEPDPA